MEPENQNNQPLNLNDKLHIQTAGTPTPQNTGPIKTLHTYASDMAEALRTQQGSVIKIAVAEQEKKQRENPFAPASNKNKVLLIATLVVLLAGGGIFFYFGYIHQDAVVRVEKKPELISIVQAEHTETLDVSSFLTRKQFGDGVALAVAASTRPVGMTNLVLTEPIPDGTKALSLDALFTKIESTAPGSLVRSLEPLYMLGINSHGDQDPFIVFQTNSYETALAGMLAWEHNLFDELYGLFAVVIDAPENQGLFEKDFEDIIVENRDGRVLRDQNGKIVIVYVFINTRTIVIANNINTIDTIIQRLDAQNAL